MSRPSRQITILVVCEPLTGGVPIYVEQIVRCLEGPEFHFFVTCPEASILFQRLPGTGADLVPLHIKRGLHVASDTLALLALAKLIKQTAPDVVHLHSSKAGLIGRLAAWPFRTRVIFTPHAFSFETFDRGSWARSLYVAAERCLASLTDQIVCVSEHEQCVAAEYRIVPIEHLRVIRNFFNPDLWFPDAPDVWYKEQLGIPVTDFVIGTISRFFLQKAPLDFLAMAEAVCAFRENVRFVFVGEGGPLESDVRKGIQAKRLEQRVHFVPWTQHISAVVGICDVIVSTSLWEGLPLSLIESMAMGKPIVATDIGPHRELLLPSSGILCPVRKPLLMAEKVNELLDNASQREALGRNALRVARERYQRDTAIKAHAKLYFECTGRLRICSNDDITAPLAGQSRAKLSSPSRS